METAQCLCQNGWLRIRVLSDMHNFQETNFGGSDYDPARDAARMSDGMAAVYSVMAKNNMRQFTLEKLAELSGVPQSSVGSYLCYLRRDFGYEVPKQHIENGLYVYSLGNKGQPKGKQKTENTQNSELYDKIATLTKKLERAHKLSIDLGTKVSPGDARAPMIRELYTVTLP